MNEYYDIVHYTKLNIIYKVDISYAEYKSFILLYYYLYYVNNFNLFIHTST